MDKRSPSISDAPRVYEDIEPPSQTFAEETCDRFVVDLSGLKKEREFEKSHLKVRLDGLGNIRTSGERPLGGHRWLRFERVFRLPEGRSSGDITAKFHGGILSVVVPKSKKDTPPASAPPTTTTTTPPPTENQEKPSYPEKEQGEQAPTPEMVDSRIPPERRQTTAKVAIGAAMAAVLMLLLGFYVRKWLNPFLDELPPLESFPEDY